MSKFFNRFVEDESGATAIEYGLIAALMGVAVIATFTLFGDKLETAFSSMGDNLQGEVDKM